MKFMCAQLFWLLLYSNIFSISFETLFVSVLFLLLACVFFTLLRSKDRTNDVHTQYTNICLELHFSNGIPLRRTKNWLFKILSSLQMRKLQQNDSFLIYKWLIFIIFSMETERKHLYAHFVSVQQIQHTTANELSEWIEKSARKLLGLFIWNCSILRNKICTLHFIELCLSITHIVRLFCAGRHDEFSALPRNNIANNMFGRVTGHSLTEWLTN